MDLPEINLKPIGVIQTPFTDRYSAPRQPALAEDDCRARLVLNPRRNFEQALEDLGGFDLIWIISWLHLNRAWKPKVLPPRGPRKKRGVFATRSPHRPNPIGISIARLISIHGRTLQLGAVDLLDGTPILDLKPYLPYADAFPDARAGWLEGVAPAGRAPNPFSVEWSHVAHTQAEWLAAEHRVELAAHATKILCHDPAPHPYRRIAQWSEAQRVLAIKSWRVRFCVDGARVNIERIASGYPLDALACARKTEQRLHDHEAHVAFHRRWPE